MWSTYLDVASKFESSARHRLATRTWTGLRTDDGEKSNSEPAAQQEPGLAPCSFRHRLGKYWILTLSEAMVRNYLQSDEEISLPSPLEKNKNKNKDQRGRKKIELDAGLYL